jgi:hypothetical protein
LRWACIHGNVDPVIAGREAPRGALTCMAPR